MATLLFGFWKYIEKNKNIIQNNMHTNNKIKDIHSLQRAITAVKLNLTSSAEYYSTLALSAGFRTQGKPKMSLAANFCTLCYAQQKSACLQAGRHFRLDRHSLAPLAHRYLINILFSLRVSGDLPSKAWQGRAGTRRVED